MLYKSCTTSFEKVAREWHAKHSQQRVPAYQKAVVRILEENLFPHIGKRLSNAITPKKLPAVLRRVEAPLKKPSGKTIHLNIFLTIFAYTEK